MSINKEIGTCGERHIQSELYIAKNSMKKSIKLHPAADSICKNFSKTLSPIISNVFEQWNDYITDLSISFNNKIW